jgi:hypothetical protein
MNSETAEKPAEKFVCKSCDFKCSKNSNWEKHLLTQKHQKIPIFKTNFICEKCDFECFKQSNWEKHLLTSKHQLNYPLAQKTAEKMPSTHTCICGKEYIHRQGLYTHKKTCMFKNTPEPSENIIIQQAPIEDVKNLTTLVIELIKTNSDLQKQNNEIQKQMIEVCKNNSINTINSHNNNNNKTFNLQFFLNEQCKDAMNITDFANSFDLQLSDLETVGELGYVNGITKIMVDKLNSMDIYKRPIHCSDAKREIIYVKDANVWTKEEKDNPKLRQAIKSVSFRNMKLVYNWSNAYPESKDNESRLNDKYMQLVIQSTGGNNPIVESENKIIRRIAKEIVIGKNNF